MAWQGLIHMNFVEVMVFSNHQSTLDRQNVLLSVKRGTFELH